MYYLLNKNLYFLKFICTTTTFFRNVRNNSKRIAAVKTIRDFKIKNADIDDFDSSLDYKEIAKRIKEDDLEIEESFLEGRDLETLVSESDKLYDKHKQEEKGRKSLIRKSIVKRKHFNLEKETNLLTYAAKQQIRHLHDTDPMKWTPEVLADSFPISVPGVKKLLNSNYVLTSPERIKAHDEDVKSKWDILLSRKPSDRIAPFTRRLWESGQLKRENYHGDPKLASVPLKKQTQPIIVGEKKKIGEYESIVQKYVELKAQKEAMKSTMPESPDATEVERTTEESSYSAKKSVSFTNKLNFNNYSKEFTGAEIPFSQFKENLKDELKSHKSSVSKKYYEWIDADSEKSAEQTSPKGSPAEFFTKVPKYKERKNESQDNKYFNKSDYYMYDEKLGYQHPEGHTVKGRIQIPKKMRKSDSVYKKGNCVYDENGELLYKLPT